MCENNYLTIDKTSLCFNMNTDQPGGTPSWGTAIGQSELLDYRLKDNSVLLIQSLTYKALTNAEKGNIRCPLGRGGREYEGNRTGEAYDINLASLYEKIYVNNQIVHDAKFIILLVKEIGQNAHHRGRRIIKYPIGLQYNDNFINKDCYSRIAQTLGLSENSAWFVSEVKFVNQDELHFKAHIVDANGPVSYPNVNNRTSAINQKILEDRNTEENNNPPKEHKGENKIFFGAPGSGKSYKLMRMLKEKGVPEENIFRITFYPEYTYGDFIGQLVPCKDERGFRYDIKRGEFLNALIRANNTEQDVYVIIEELSRGNASEIFGDVFQLLDRKEHESTYKINNEIISSNVFSLENKKIAIPNNLYIYCTLNTNDQSVFPLDTAFKRRFLWEYVPFGGNKDEEGNLLNSFSLNIIIDGEENPLEVDWNCFIEKFNTFISSKNYLDLGEDKQLGQFFIEPRTNNREDINSQIKNKLLFFIWNDIHKAIYKNYLDIFAPEVSSYSSLVQKFDNNEQIFNLEFINLLR